MAYKGKRVRHGFKLTIILVCFVVLLALLGVVMILGTGGSGKLPDLPTDPTKAPAPPAATAGDSGFVAGDPQNSFHQEAKEEKETKVNLWDMITDALDKDNPNETEEVTFGIDVARYQGTIDWQQVAAAGVDFAMVRLGYRSLEDGVITLDTNAAYNLQQAQKNGIKLGAYFFSTAITKEEAIEEANWVADFLEPYPITYPVAYNCEGFNEPQNRQYGLTKHQRTDIALAFLKQIEKRGYEAMFYASKNEMTDDAQWQVSRIDPDYKIWVAQYPEKPYPETEKSSYEGTHHMWQYTRSGVLPGIPEGVDVNIAYFGYTKAEDAQSKETAPPAQADPEALMEFEEVNRFVTAKSETNLRSIPSQGDDAEILYTLKNGETARLIGVSDSGWSKVEFNGKIYYAVSSYLTDDLDGTGSDDPPADLDGDGIETKFRSVNEQVTAKDMVNLRNIPSTTRADASIVGQLANGDIATRTGISDNGWSRLDVGGTTCYAVSSYLTTDVSGGSGDAHQPGIQTQFREVSDSVTAKEVVNLRSLPSTTDPDCKVVAQLKKGDVIPRTGVNEDVGWSRVVYEGQTLYCVTQYLEVIQ